MLGNSPYLTQQAFAHANGRFLSISRINHIYRFAQLKGRFAKLWARLTHQSRKLLDSKLFNLGDGHYAGLRTVSIDRIKGSEGRNGDFDSAFYPLKTHNKDRWVRVAAARLRGVVLPPVDLIRVGDIYFVRDGHHRISVARAFGEEFIDAVVTVIEVK
ncbi:MAG: hypothetical protein PVG14_07155 [Anaerolineales bacterium]|jgi:hypothetical protein